MPTLCLVEVIQLSTEAADGDSVIQKKQSENHHTLSSHADVRCSISTKFLHDDSGGPYHHFTLTQTFLGPVNSLAARGHRIDPSR